MSDGYYPIPRGEEPTTCRSCGAAIVWARMGAGKAIPLDLAHVRGQGEAREALNHFATCEHGREWRVSAPARTVQPLNSLFVPTVVIDGLRHIIAHRDGPALCGAEGEREQHAPQAYSGRRLNDLCTRCRQRYARRVLEAAHGPLSWEQ